MTFFTKTLNPFSPPLIEEWIEHLSELENTTEHPLAIALSSLDELEQEVAGEQEEFSRCLLEDIIFNSINVSFYQTLLEGIISNKEVASELLENFSTEAQDLAHEIASETENHVNFLENENFCEGCPHCDKHKDFAHLIGPIVREDLDALIKEYLKVKTLYFSLEKIIFDVLPQEMNQLEKLSLKDVELLKHHVIKSVNERLHSI